MKQLFGNTIDLLEKSIDLRVKRNTVLTSNVVNMDTPGYKAKDVPFNEIMARYMGKESSGFMWITNPNHIDVEASLPPGTTNARHIPIGPEPGADPFHVSVSAERGTPNNVDIDREMAEIAVNNIQYQTAVQSLIKKFDGLRTAITEGGKS
ncbi:MAG: flagellar basal body rod protein FlgB [Dissulfuribacterales bacterium]